VTTGQNTAARSNSRPRGRPRLEIDLDAVAEAVAELLSEGGYDAVGVPEVAEKLSISRATLYRTVPTKVDLMGILFERRTRDLSRQARATIAATADPAEQLTNLIRLNTNAAVQMRNYMSVFFGGGDLPPEVYSRWRTWIRRYENMWMKVVTANMRDGYLVEGDPVVTTRLILGMCVWISRWYRPSENLTSDEIADAAINLLKLKKLAPDRAAQNTNGQALRSSSTRSR